jgi:hypothetical protein
MKITSIAFLSVTLNVLLAQTASATMSPIPLSGWNQDLIAENTAPTPAAGTTTSIVPPGGVSTSYGVPSNVGWVFYETGAPNSTQGLPANGTINSAANAGVTFQLLPYIGNNAALNSGTLTLATPAPYTSLPY